MTNQPVLRSRTQPATAPVPASEADAQLSVAMREANAIAKAGDAVPKGYRGNPGAVLLARAWAENRGLDILTALQTVSFVQGRPVIDATMQRALADQAGYRITIPTADAQRAIVRVVEKSTGEVIGEATYTLEDAKVAGLTGKENWKKNPEDMLVARATTRAVRRFAPAVMVGLVAGEDEMDEIAPDPVAVLDSNAGEDQDPKTVDVAHNPVGESEEPSAANAAPESSPADIEDAEIVDDQPITDPTRGKVLDAMREAKKRDDWGQVAQEMQGEGIQMVASKMTEAEGQLVLGILGSGE